MRTIITLSIIALSLCGLSVNAYDFMVNGLAYNINTDQTSVFVTYEIKSSGPSYLEEPEGALVIPATVNYNNKIYPVTAIGPYSFQRCTKITSVMLSSNSLDINDYAFFGCSNLKDISLGGVKTIGALAFEGTSIENLTIPNSVTSISKFAFYNCTKLKKVIIGDGVISIGHMAFAGCEDVDLLIVGESVQKVGEGDSENRVLPISKKIVWNAINCNYVLCSLTPCDESVIIGNKVKRIPYGFLSCRTQWGFHSQVPLEIVIPESVESIGSWAFYRFHFINKDLNIPASVNSIERRAFEMCGLESVIIPNAAIEEFAFSGNKLKTVTIGTGVNQIGSKAFMDNTEMLSFHNLNPVPQIISDDVFSNENYLNCTLYVPSGSVSKYKSAQGWQLFRKIVGENSGIEDIESDQLNVNEIERYNVEGRMLSAPQPGINIVRYSDGSVRKVIVQ